MTTQLTPLITAAEGFPALERLAASARRELVMSFRILDPDTRLRSHELREQGLDTWADLLADISRKGVRIRLILADFDAIFAADLHRLAWDSASRFADRLEGDAQVICAPHGQRAGWLWHLGMRARIMRVLQKLRSEDGKALTPVQRSMLEGPVVLRPVTLHQKFAVADSERSIIGGLDINERRFDDHKHDRPAEETWHDVSIEVHNPAFAAELRWHFSKTWNAALDCGAPCLTGDCAPEDIAKRPDPASDLTLIRTFSAPCSGVARLSPRASVTEHEDTMLQIIGEAQRHIYIETQFLRHGPIADALVKAAEREADLQLVMILPPAADRVLFEGNDSWDARHGHALQTNAMNRLKRAFGDRLAAVSPGRPAPASDDVAEVLGSGPIYVHSKVACIDDRVGIIGSANLNGRSMRWDTEASILFRRREDVKTVRERLAKVWLNGQMEGHDLTRARTWRQAALENAAQAPEDRRSFVLPYPYEKGRRFSRFVPVLPADMF